MCWESEMRSVKRSGAGLEGNKAYMYLLFSGQTSGDGRVGMWLIGTRTNEGRCDPMK
jgi:hypothetical protein